MKKSNIIFLLLLLVIGFASVSTTLILNGTIGIANKQDDFDVIFTSATLDDEKSENATISEDKKSITFTSKRLRELNESVRLDYKVKNNSTQYGANVTISCNSYGNEYVSVTGEFDGKSIPLTNPVEMEAQEIKNGYINAEIVKVYGGEDDSISLTCTISASATSKDKVTEYVPTPYKEDLLNGADPILKDELIPVTIADNGTVIYADIEEKWYSYENKEWANAVILIDNPSKIYKENDVIKEDDIEAYFVWIPRYRYQLFHTNQENVYIEGIPATSIAKEIQIEFEGKDTSISTGKKDGEWLTHPAFTNFDVNGIWVGKFETGYEGATSTASSQINAIDSSKILIKPNVYSWRNTTVGNMFKTAYNYKREMDSHMMKNTEWGAVAYLSHSKYGINKEININNNSNYLTGYSAVEGTNQSSYPGTSGADASKTLAYNTPTGYKASTTGNITGIYDMSGGAIEYVAAYVEGYGVQNNSNVVSSFTTSELTTYAKYLDKYSSNSTITTYSNRILGDATGEMGPFYHSLYNGANYFYNSWYGDSSHFLGSGGPWLHRGGNFNHGGLGGAFYFDEETGGPHSYDGFRLVLTPQ